MSTYTTIFKQERLDKVVLGEASIYDLCVSIMCEIEHLRKRSTQPNDVFAKKFLASSAGQIGLVQKVAELLANSMDREFTDPFLNRRDRFKDNEINNTSLADASLKQLFRAFLQSFSYKTFSLFKMRNPQDWDSSRVSYKHYSSEALTNFSQDILDIFWNMIRWSRVPENHTLDFAGLKTHLNVCLTRQAKREEEIRKKEKETGEKSAISNQDLADEYRQYWYEMAFGFFESIRDAVDSAAQQARDARDSRQPIVDNERGHRRETTPRTKQSSSSSSDEDAVHGESSRPKVKVVVKKAKPQPDADGWTEAPSRKRSPKTTQATTSA